MRNFLRLGLLGIGALAVLSAAVNIAATWRLIDAAEEQSLGISRGEFMVTYGVIGLVGAALVLAGFRLKK